MRKLIWVLIVATLGSPVGGLVLGMVGCISEEEELREFRTMTLIVEEELEKWKPDHENLVPVIKEIFDPKVDICGYWETPIFLDGSSLKIRRTEAGQYSIDFSTSGCEGEWDLKRTGTYSKGIVYLNKPVEEYSPCAPYDTLYAVSFDGKEYLISQAEIRLLLEHYSVDGVIDWSEHIEDAFHRKGKEDTQQDREE